jgi:glycogen synthase
VKRVDDLFGSMMLLSQGWKLPVTLDVYGDGPDRPRLQRLLENLDLSPVARMRGFTRDVPLVLAQLDCLVLPSMAEGFGLVLIEAMASGVPVIGTDVPGIRDVVRHEETGLLTSVISSSALAFSIRRMMEDAELRSRLVANARREVAERFSWDVILPRYKELLGISTSL